jgi:hypothetical protein
MFEGWFADVCVVVILAVKINPDNLSAMLKSCLAKNMPYGIPR